VRDRAGNLLQLLGDDRESLQKRDAIVGCAEQKTCGSDAEEYEDIVEDEEVEVEEVKVVEDLPKKKKKRVTKKLRKVKKQQQGVLSADETIPIPMYMEDEDDFFADPAQEDVVEPKNLVKFGVRVFPKDKSPVAKDKSPVAMKVDNRSNEIALFDLFEKFPAKEVTATAQFIGNPFDEEDGSDVEESEQPKPMNASMMKQSRKKEVVDPFEELLFHPSVNGELVKEKLVKEKSAAAARAPASIAMNRQQVQSQQQVESSASFYVVPVQQQVAVDQFGRYYYPQQQQPQLFWR